MRTTVFQSISTLCKRRKIDLGIEPQVRKINSSDVTISLRITFILWEISRPYTLLKKKRLHHSKIYYLISLSVSLINQKPGIFRTCYQNLIILLLQGKFRKEIRLSSTRILSWRIINEKEKCQKKWRASLNYQVCNHLI